MADSIDKLAYSSIRNYLHGIATTHVELGHPNPLEQSPLPWRMFKAIKRIQGERTVTRKRLPITVKILAQIDSLCDTTNQLHLCMRAAMWLGTCGLLRSGEFTRKVSTKHTLKLNHLTFHSKDDSVIDPLDTTLDAPLYMSLQLDQSKTDPFRHGTTVVVSNAYCHPGTCWHIFACGNVRLADSHSSLVTMVKHCRPALWSSSPSR